MSLAPFVRSDSGFHPTVDRRTLLEDFEETPLTLWNISGPADLVAWERLRERHGITDAAAVPCDLFLWGVGEPPDQRLTRVGGTPWLPRCVAWPEIDGLVTSFLCQFDFRDSRDLVGELPGDLLLVFVADEDAMFLGDVNRLRFVWVSADESEIISAAEVPEPTHPFEHVRAWGARYRTADLPGCWDRAYELDEELEDGSQLWHSPVLWGTKIGGVPHHSQENHDFAPDGYLCQLVSIQAGAERWPWIDRDEPLPGRAYDESNTLMIGDLGELSFFLDPDGTVGIESACG